MIVMLRYYFLKTPEYITIKDTIVLDETQPSTSKRDIATNTILNKQELDDISTHIGRKFNDLSDEVEKRLHNIEDQINGMKYSN